MALPEALLLLLQLLLLTLVNAGQEFEGECPKVPPVENFNHTRYAGEKGKNVWFLYWQLGGLQDRRCTHEYHYVLDDGRIQFFKQYVRKSDNKIIKGSGTVYPVQDGVARLKGSARDDDYGVYTSNEFDNNLIAIDYDNYGIISHCHTYIKDGKKFHFQSLSIFTRIRTTKDQLKTRKNVRKMIRSALKYFRDIFNLKLALNDLTKVDQKRCPPAEEPCVTMVNSTYERCPEKQ